MFVNNQMIMKKIFSYVLLSVIILSCTKTEPEIGGSFVQADGIIGSWEISGANVVDLLTIEARSADVSEYYVIQGEPSSTMVFTEEGGERTFTLQLNNGINFITGPDPNAPTTGTWEVNSEFQASDIILKDASGNVINTLYLTQSVRPYSQEMLLGSKQYCGEEAVHGYEYEFSRKSN